MTVEWRGSDDSEPTESSNPSVIDPEGQLARRLSAALSARGTTVDAVAERTKVPRSTIHALLGAPDPAILPQRIYMRGHIIIIARELGIPTDEAARLFDAEHPVERTVEEEVRPPGFNRPAVALAAGLCSIAVLAVILAFIS